MYAVVGCRDCAALWVVEGRPDSTRCPRCGTRRQFSKLRKFAETDDDDEAKQARAALLARRQGESEAFADLDPFGALEARAADAGPDEETVLEATGVDSEAVAEAGERAERGEGRGGPNRVDVVRTAVRELDAPAAEDVVEYAADRDVEPSRARETLDRLVARGELLENRGTYRQV